MKSITIRALVTSILLAGTASAVAVPLGGGLQGVLDSHTCVSMADCTTPTTSSVNVWTDQYSPDEQWMIDASGGSVTTFVVELAGYAGSNTFGVYDVADPTKKVQLFAGADTAGAQALLSILADGSVKVNFVDSGIDFASNRFGYYLGVPADGNTFYSQTGLNGDGLDHMLAYRGVGDIFQILPYAAGPWSSGEFILAWEDMYGLGDQDYDDLVVMVESVTPVPEPAAISLLGLGLLGLSYAARKRKVKQ